MPFTTYKNKDKILINQTNGGNLAPPADPFLLDRPINCKQRYPPRPGPQGSGRFLWVPSKFDSLKVNVLFTT